MNGIPSLPHIRMSDPIPTACFFSCPVFIAGSDGDTRGAATRIR